MRILWTQATDDSLRGLALARESGWSLAWDSASWLHLFNRTGERQALVQFPTPVAQAACADDGHSFAVVTSNGRVRLLARDLMPRWEREVEQPGLAVALSALGDYLAVADSSGGIHLYDRSGKRLWKVALPRSCKYLAFVPELPMLVGAADFGLVVCLNSAGEVVWRDGLVARVGSLSIAAGATIALACYGDGLWCYDLAGRKRQRLDLAPCSQAVLSYTGDAILTIGLEQKVRLLDRAGSCLSSTPLEGAVQGLALAPLADVCWVGLGEGKILVLRVEAGGA